MLSPKVTTALENALPIVLEHFFLDFVYLLSLLLTALKRNRIYHVRDTSIPL